MSQATRVLSALVLGLALGIGPESKGDALLKS